jgi:hypothetical protein
MSSTISDTPSAPLIKLDLPSPEDYRKRKVALISGKSSRLWDEATQIDADQVSPVRMDLTCEKNAARSPQWLI